jgi:hypothetical protein
MMAIASFMQFNLLGVLRLDYLAWGILFTILIALLVFLIRASRPDETAVQQAVHALEEGRWVRRVQVIILLAAIAFLNYLWFFKEGSGFKGLGNEKAMEQAQIARELSRGHGFTTKMIRPAAIRQFERATGSFPLEHTPDTYHAPLNPWINAFVFWAMDKSNEGMKKLSEKQDFFERYTFETEMTTKLVVYSYDRILAFVQMFFFLASMVVCYFTAQRLFDERLATFGTCMLLLCQRFWDFAISGLPQMLLLFLFSCAVYTLVRAVEARCSGGKALPWLCGAAAFFGLLALAHGLTIWVFAGLLVFSIFYFRPMGRDAAIMAVIFMLFYGPWMVRNYKVCGNFVGLGWYSALYQVRGTEAQVMRSMELPLSGVSPTVFRNKVQGQILGQMEGIYALFGRVLMVPVFFVTLLHLFKRREIANFRWCILSMWIFAVFGMAVFGMSDGTALQSNDLHVLFIPLMTYYGFAFVLGMWARLEINYRLARIGFMSLLYVVSALPFANQFIVLFFGPQTGRVQWPPYVPPYIAILANWTREDEIITSDMPWGVAWYADRKSLWLPNTLRDWSTLYDYNQIKGQIVGLYLTPVTGNKAFISEVVKGEYKEWAPFITRTANLRDFPLKAVTPLPIDGECIYYSDRDRWTNRED